VERMMTSPLSPGCRTRICSKVKHCMVHCANYTLNEYLIPADHWAWCFTTHNTSKVKRGVGLSKNIIILYIAVISSTCTSLLLYSQYWRTVCIWQNQYSIWHGISWNRSQVMRKWDFTAWQY
jgi:hypothetical protein